MKSGSTLAILAAAALAGAAALRSGKGAPVSPKAKAPPTRGSAATPDLRFDPREATLSFDLHFEEDNFNEDLYSDEEDAKERVKPFLLQVLSSPRGLFVIDDRGKRTPMKGIEQTDLLQKLDAYVKDGKIVSNRQLLKAEGDALAEIAMLLGRRVTNFGHDSSGDLICQISINSLQDLAEVVTLINQKSYSEALEIDVAPYHTARGWILRPNRGTNIDLQDIEIKDRAGGLRLQHRDHEEDDDEEDMG